MVTIDQRAVEEVVHEGTSMTTDELLDVLERYHDDRPGVPAEAVAGYVEALADREDFGFDAERFLDELERRRTDAETWTDDAIYELDGDRLSRFPGSWHDRLGGETDPVAYLRFFEEVDPPFHREGRGGRPYVSQDRLVEVMQAVGGADRETARSAIEQARDDDTVAEDADQHPRAGVYLTE